MNRRDAVPALIAMGTAPLVAEAQPAEKVWRLGDLSPRSGPERAAEASREQLRGKRGVAPQKEGK